MSMIPVQSGNVIALVAAIVLGAFVSEDGATITAATLAASSVLDLRLASLSAFAGLWAGDMGVYALTRGIARRIMHPRWFAGWFKKVKTRKGNASGNNAHLTTALTRFLPWPRLR